MIGGLYIHIPYCRQLCHYCDFAKTANHNAEHLQLYMSTLIDHTLLWIAKQDVAQKQIRSVFLGGGTPSLYTNEWARFFAAIQNSLADDCEISIEANPDDINDTSLASWKSVGINRLSVGVQTFQDNGLQFLKRIHNSKTALAKIDLAKKYFDNLNIDLIYGWQEQTLTQWQDDLQKAAQLAPHLSLYNLTYESQTPIGRQMNRGKIEVPSDSKLEKYYITAMELLENFNHEEVSNWSQSGYECQHNWLYWNNEYFLGIGTGAHGYLPEGKFGIRYAYDRNDRNFLKQPPAESAEQSCTNKVINFEVDRDADDWLIENIGNRLRTHKGIDLDLISSVTQRSFKPTVKILAGQDAGLLNVSEGELILSKTEWFRENAWALEVISSFDLPY